MMRTHTLAAAISTALLAVGLTGCGATTDTSVDPPSAASPAEVGTSQADALVVTDPWVKAVDDGMTAFFADLANSGTQELTLVGAHTEAAATVELHQTVTGDGGALVMQETQDGFHLAGHGSHHLEPGGDHVMLIGVNAPLRPGDTVLVTLTMADGSTLDVDATVKPFAGAQEEYHPDGHDEHGHSEHDRHGEHDGHSEHDGHGGPPEHGDQ